MTELQTRLAFQEDDLKQLGLTMAQQQRELAALRREVDRLRQLVRALEPSQVVPRADEPPPPHY